MSKKILKLRQWSGLIIITLCLSMLCQQAIPAQAYTNSSATVATALHQTKSASVDSFSSIGTYKLNYKKYQLVKGKSFALKVTKLPANYRVTYKSSSTNIATVNTKGSVVGKKHGTATITATIRYKTQILRKLTCKVIVGPAAISVVIPESNITLALKEQKDLKAIVKPKYSTEAPRFSSSNPNVVSVTSAGIIKGIKKGTAVITVTIANKKYDKCTVIVKAPSTNASVKNKNSR